MDRQEVEQAIRSCGTCEISTRCKSPVPLDGPVPAPIAVLGEAPGGQENEQGRPFVGPAGKVLKDALRTAGFDPGSIAYINTVSCYPTRENGKGRTPSSEEVNACSGHREMQLRLVDPEWVILTGNVPLQAYRPDLRIGKMHGRPFNYHPKVWFFPVYHPAAVLRNPAWGRDLALDLATLKKLVDQVLGWEDLIPETCVTCGRSVKPDDTGFRWDSHGIPYCEFHWLKSPEGREK